MLGNTTVGEVAKLLEEAAASRDLTEHQAHQLLALGGLTLQHLPSHYKEQQLGSLGLFETEWQTRLKEVVESTQQHYEG